MLGKPLTQVQQARGGRDAYVPRRSLLSKTGTRGSLPELVRPPTLAHPGPKPGSCSEDGLACALLEVLKNYQAQAPAPVSVPRQSALKPQVPAQSSLALVLHSVLEAAVNNAWDDSKVAERVSAKILTWQKQRHQAVGASESNSHARRVSFSDSPVDPRSPRTEGLEAPKGKGKGKGKLPSNSNPGGQSFYPTAAKPPKPVPHKPQAPLAEKPPNRKPPNQNLRPVVRVVASEWSSPPQVSTVGAIRKALEEGSELPGNLVLCDTTEGVSNLQALWAAYQCVAPVTVALVAKQESTVSSKDKQQESTVSSKGMQSESLVSVGRQGSLRNEVVRVVCSQLSEQAGPVPKRAITTKIPVSSVVSKVTVRLLAPQCFRQFVAGVETEDDSRVIISEWAKLLECPLADLTGGTWERISDKSGNVVVGHLRVSRSLAHKIVNLSGTRAAPSSKTKASSSGGLSLPSSTPRRAPSVASGLSLPSSAPAKGSGSLSLCGSSRCERLTPKTRCFSSPDPVLFPKTAFGLRCSFGGRTLGPVCD